MERIILGNHIVADVVCRNKRILNDMLKLRKLMLEAAKIGNATVVADNFHQFLPYGISGILIISESHISIHTWPEYSIASIDIYTCGNNVRVEKIYDYFKLKLKVTNENIKIFERNI